jgi:hypothetical protein
MTVDKALIVRLLNNDKLKYFDENLIFATQIADHPEAARILVEMIIQEKHKRAEEMLSYFSHPGLEAVIDKLPEANPALRSKLILLAWNLILNSAEREYSSIYDQSQQILKSLLQDTSKMILPEVEIPEQYKVWVESETDQRICDEVFLFLKFLKDPEHDSALFLSLPYEDRDELIRELDRAV